MAKKGPRILISLVCSHCHSQNYITEKNKLNKPEKLTFKKYCRRCRKHTLHKESTKLK
jgi:large subunit ribosomal protein L33